MLGFTSPTLYTKEGRDAADIRLNIVLAWDCSHLIVPQWQGEASTSSVVAPPYICVSRTTTYVVLMRWRSSPESIFGGPKIEQVRWTRIS
jgi:hypothetical protein